MSQVEIEYTPATEADEAELRRILRENPMPGQLTISLEREPDFFLGSSLEGEVHQTIAARVKGARQIAGMGSRSVFPAWINGIRDHVGYLSQLRVDRPFRSRMGGLFPAYDALHGVHCKSADTKLYVSTIIEDNVFARRYLAAGRSRGLPAYQELEAFSTLAIPLWRKKRVSVPAGHEIRRAVAADLPGICACLNRNMAAYQFAPIWTEESLLDPERSRNLTIGSFLVAEKAGVISGCLAIWDQQPFKQTVVQSYRGALKYTRHLVNAVAPLLGNPWLPKPGKLFRHIYFSHIAVDSENLELLQALVTTAFNDCVGKGLSYVTLGFASRDPLLQPIKRSFRYVEYRSVVYVVYWDDGIEAAAKLDGRIPYLEVARL